MLVVLHHRLEYPSHKSHDELDSTLRFIVNLLDTVIVIIQLRRIHLLARITRWSSTLVSKPCKYGSFVTSVPNNEMKPRYSTTRRENTRLSGLWTRGRLTEGERSLASLRAHARRLALCHSARYPYSRWSTRAGRGASTRCTTTKHSKFPALKVPQAPESEYSAR